MYRSKKDFYKDFLFLRPLFRKYKTPESFDDIDSNMVDGFLILGGIMFWLNVLGWPFIIYDTCF